MQTRFRYLGAIVILLAATGCETVNSDGWTGSNATPFGQAERSCEEQSSNIEVESDRSQFFTGCMKALGWTPKPGVKPDI